MAAEAAASSGMDRTLTRYDAARDGGRVRLLPPPPPRYRRCS